MSGVLMSSVLMSSVFMSSALVSNVLMSSALMYSISMLCQLCTSFFNQYRLVAVEQHKQTVPHSFLCTTPTM